ncbi:MAG: YibE/F family protein [Firmicutes bacterium]|nr:YibE/F family protein [Bacillota bacterium]
MKLRKPSMPPASYIVTVVLAAVFLVLGNRVAGGKLFPEEEGTELIRARTLAVVSVERDNYSQDDDSLVMTTVTFDAKALEGPRKGMTLRCRQEIDNVYGLALPQVKARDVVLLDVQKAGDGPSAYVLVDFVRTAPLILLGVLFAVLLVLSGRKKGADTLLSFVFSILSIFLVLVPALLSGHNIYLWSLLICVYIVVTNLLIVQGASSKSLCAALGCLGGVLCAGLIMLLVNRPMHITGLIEEDSIFLKAMGIDIRATVFCMILIGSVGALMDVAMDIAAALKELRQGRPGITGKELMRAGLNIGQDLIGTMANTLVLAYIGESMGLLLVMIHYSPSAAYMVNREMIAVAILQCLAGCLSVLAVVPLTSFFCSLFYTSKPPKTVEY